MGDYEKMCERMGLNAGSEEDYECLTQALLSGTRPTPRRSHLKPRAPLPKELRFSTFSEAGDWSKSNGGRPFTRTIDGLHFTPAGDELARPGLHQGAGIEPPSEAQLRFTALKAWRANVARESNLPAYAIFHDATLAAIAANAPLSVSSLRDLGGIGERKLQAYGDAIIRVVQEVSGSSE